MICEVYLVPPATAERLVGEPSAVLEVLSDLPDASSALSLEKSWHGLHFVLTGSEWGGAPPLNFLVAGGEPLGEHAFDSGPARLLAPADVKALDEALAVIGDEEFDAKFDLKELDQVGIYPQIWDEPREELLEEYLSYFQELKSLVRRAAESGSALMVSIT